MQTYYYNDVSVLVGLWQSEKSVGGISFEYWYPFSMIFGGVGKFWLLGICLCFVSDVSHVEWMWDEMRSRTRFKGLYPQVFTVVSLGTAWERQKKVFRCNNLKLVSIGPTSNGGRSRRTQGGPWWPSWDQTAKPWSDEKRWSWFCSEVNRVLVPSECMAFWWFGHYREFWQTMIGTIQQPTSVWITPPNVVPAIFVVTKTSYFSPEVGPYRLKPLTPISHNNI